MDKNKDPKLHTVLEDGTFLFDHDREHIMSILDKRYEIIRGLFPFWAKRKYEEAFIGGYYGGYQDGYKDAYSYLTEKLGMNKDTKDVTGKFQFLDEVFKEKFGDTN